MLKEADRKLVRTYYGLLKMAVPALVMSFVPPFVWGLLVAIDDGVLESRLGFFSLGLAVMLAIVIFNLVLFSYAALRVKLGTSGKRWRRILATDPGIPQTDANCTSQAAAALGTAAAGRLMSKSSNEAVSAAGDAVQAAAAVESVMVATKQVGNLSENVRAVADRFGIELPSMRGPVIALVVVSLAALPVTYAPRFAATLQQREVEVQTVSQAIAPIRSSFEATFPSVYADDPSDGVRDTYKVSADANDDLDSYVYVTLTGEGTVKEVAFHMEYPEGATPQEVLAQFESRVDEFARPLVDSGATADGWPLDKAATVPAELASSFLETAPSQNSYETLTQDGVRYALSFYPKSESDEPYLYFTAKAPR